MTFTAIDNVLSGKFVGKKVDIRGWVYRKRESKDTVFIIVRDASGVIQCTVKKKSKAWKEAEKITIESSLTLSGAVKEDKRAPGDYEITTIDGYTVLRLPTM